MNAGKDFEQQIKASIPPDVYELRIKDPAASFASPDSLRFSPNNPFDYLLFRSPTLFALELKTTTGAISFHRDDDPARKSVMIKKCQIEGLRKAAEHDGIAAGFLLNFRESEATYFLPIADFLAFRAQSAKKSINEKDIIELGAFVVPQVKKRTKYSFDITSMLDYAERYALKGVAV